MYKKLREAVEAVKNEKLADDVIYDEITEEDEKRILKRWENSKSEKTASAEEVFKRLEL